MDESEQGDNAKLVQQLFMTDTHLQMYTYIYFVRNANTNTAEYKYKYEGCCCSLYLNIQHDLYANFTALSCDGQ